MTKKENVLIVLNIILVISLIITLVFGVEHYKQISNNSSIEEHQIDTMVNTIKKEVDTEGTGEVKNEEKISTKDQNKKNEMVGENSSISSTKKIIYKSSSNNSGHAVKSSKKVQNVTEAPRKEESQTETEKEEEVKPIEVVDSGNTISIEDRSKLDNAQPSNSSGNEPEKPIEQSAVNEGGNSIINNSTTNDLPINNEIESNSSNDGESKDQNQ